jgi:hypothetical protein
MVTTYPPPSGPDGVRSLLRIARSAVRSFSPQVGEAVLDEVAQEAVARWWRDAGSVERPAGFVSEVARRLAVDQVRRARREVGWMADPAIDAWARVDARLDLERARRILALAPARHRRILGALWFEDAGFDELVEREVQGGRSREKARDALYKQRTRAKRWIRIRLGEADPSPIRRRRSSGNGTSRGDACTRGS